MPKDGRRDLQGLEGGGCNFHMQLFCLGGRVKFWYTTPFWSSPRGGGGRVTFCYPTPFWCSPSPPPPPRPPPLVPIRSLQYKRSEMFIWSVTICLFRYDVYRCKLIFISKALLNILTSDKLDTLSSKFHQHHNFYNLWMSSPEKKDVTYKSIEP